MYPEKLIERQLKISAELGVSPQFDPADEVAKRVKFMFEYLVQTESRALVLGISGGIDSATAGRLAQSAVERAREQGYSAQFVAVRLPYGIQRDEDDAERALQFIQPDHTVYIDIKPAADATLAALVGTGIAFRDAAHEDFVLGNIKARQRMIAQYAIANARSGLVIGTDHAAEALMGFFTKFGDGACDLTPLAGLNKRRIRAVALTLGAPQSLVHKIPTADLESLTPQRPDEDAYGISYDQIDDFLEGKFVSSDAYETIFRFFEKTQHKRTMPAEPTHALARRIVN